MIKDIIFDLGGVLIDWNPRHMYRKIFQDEEKMEWFLSNICTGEWNAEQDAGRTLEEATKILLDRHPLYHDKILAYYDRWTEMLNGPITGTVAILEKLSEDGRFPLYALTNWSHETFPYAIEKFAFLNLFKEIIVSGIVKKKKPDPEIYHILIKRCRLTPGTSLFIDDSAANIAAADKLGFQTIHFQSSTQCQSEMEKMGIF